jgi:hypothetical protein
MARLPRGIHIRGGALSARARVAADTDAQERESVTSPAAPHRGPGKHVATSHFLQYLCLDVCRRSPGRDMATLAPVRVWRAPAGSSRSNRSGSKILPCSPDICTCCRLDSSTVFYSITGRLAPCRRAAASRLLFPQAHLISLVESNATTKTSPTGCHEFGIPRYAAACAGAP